MATLIIHDYITSLKYSFAFPMDSNLKLHIKNSSHATLKIFFP